MVPGCEGHHLNYGGVTLTRLVDGGWVPVVYVAGFLPQRCDVRVERSGGSRLACLEAYGLNSGTYMTIASVVDWREGRVDWLLQGQCEEGFDIEDVRWSVAEPPTVNVSLTFGVSRDNDGDHCFDRFRTKQRMKLDYELVGGARPTEASLQKLLRLRPPTPPQDRLDPAVARATGYRERVPKHLLPAEGEPSFTDVSCPARP